MEININDGDVVISTATNTITISRRNSANSFLTGRDGSIIHVDDLNAMVEPNESFEWRYYEWYD